MPIKGRSEIVRIPRVGKIHLGVKETSGKSGNQYPKATDYFVVRADDNTTSESVKAFQSIYGEQPKEIKVAFPSDVPEDFFPQYLTAYRGGNGQYTLFCRGDGEKATRREDDGNFKEIQCLFEECPFYQKKQCRALGRLQFFLPEVPGIGVWQIDTTSYHTTVNLNSSIAMILALTGGRIKMIPLTLRLIPKVVSPEGKSKMVYVLDLRVEDVKLIDFIQQVPLLSAALTPAVEPIRTDEVAEDLYTDADVVDSAVGRLPATSADSVQDEPVVDGEIGTYIESEQKEAKNGQMVGKVKIITENGETIEPLTVDPAVLSMLPLPDDVKKVRYQIEPSKHFKNRSELLFIMPA